MRILATFSKSTYLKAQRAPLAILLSLALTACAAQPAPVQMPGDGLEDDPMSILVNNTRQTSHLSRLIRSERLDKAAVAHGQDMAQNNFFSHVSSDGSRLGGRVKRQGYTACFAAENIGWGSPYAAPEAMFEGWMASQGHRQNILTTRATEFGYARVEDPDGSHDPLWVMVFGKPGC